MQLVPLLRLALFSLAGCFANAWTVGRPGAKQIDTSSCVLSGPSTRRAATSPKLRTGAAPPTSGPGRRRRGLRRLATGSRALRVAAWPLTAAATVRGGGSEAVQAVRWTGPAIARAVAIFVASGVAEIGGGWLVWKAVREGRPWWWAVVGSAALVLYGFVPTLQRPTESFGRVYAVYGGFFIFLSYLWGWAFDGMRPDLGDVIGGILALVAVSVILFWPRQT